MYEIEASGYGATAWVVIGGVTDNNVGEIYEFFENAYPTYVADEIVYLPANGTIEILASRR